MTTNNHITIETSIMQSSKQTRSSILVTEDYDPMRQTIRKWLSREFPTMFVYEAVSAEDALEIVATRSISLVLMDFHLPGMTGFEATAKLKAANPALPVIILTVQQGAFYEQKAKEVEADAYILKHRMHTELIPAIVSLLGPAAHVDIRPNEPTRLPLED